MIFGVARKLSVALVGALVLGSLLVAYSSQQAEADHEPANKLAAAGSETEIFGPGQTVPILQERVRVSSVADLILQVTAECDILTDLTTGGDGPMDSAGAFGQVRMWITIDDKVVPVSSDDVTETGKVVFCNRAHNKTVQDREGDEEVDEERDMTQTRQANAFNWLALDTGFIYDDPANGNNILDIVLFAEFTETAMNDDSNAEARVGHRTLIVEPTNASVHESVESTDPGGGS